MTTTYSYEKAKKSFDLVFKKATLDGKVAIRKDNELYILMPASKNISPLDIEGVDMGLSIKDIIEFIHESRRL
jgi:hypothetical protein